MLCELQPLRKALVILAIRVKERQGDPFPLLRIELHGFFQDVFCDRCHRNYGCFNCPWPGRYSLFRGKKSRSVILLDGDGETEDLLEEIGFGVHGEAFDRGVFEAGETDIEAAGGAGDFDFRNTLGMGALEGIGNAEDGGEFADTDAVFRQRAA